MNEIELKDIIISTIREYLNEQYNGINISDYNNPNFIDGKIFTKKGGRLVIGKYDGKKPYSVVELFVDENFRRKGIATELIKSAMDYFIDGFTAQVSNPNSLDLHYNLGFRSFDNQLNTEDYQTTKNRLTKNSSVNMASPKLLKNLSAYYG